MFKILKTVIGALVVLFVMEVSLNLDFAQSGPLEPPGSAFDSNGNPISTSPTFPSWDAVRFD